MTLALPGGALANFPCKLRLQIFIRPGVQVRLLHPLAMPISYHLPVTKPSQSESERFMCEFSTKTRFSVGPVI